MLNSFLSILNITYPLTLKMALEVDINSYFVDKKIKVRKIKEN